VPERPSDERIDAVTWQRRVDRMSELFSSMIAVADDLSTRRCPYKNRFDQCTAQFGCRNQRKPHEPGALKHCAGDDKLDYRSAWETE
jgi:hypothetical protein